MKAAFTLTPAESKRLIARAVVAMPEVQAAWSNAYIIIAGGTTNAFVAQELLHVQLEPGLFTAGISSHGVQCVKKPEGALTPPVICYRGEIVKKTVKEALEDFHKETIVIKGGNAIDPEGNIGIVAAGFDGGMVAATIGYVMSQGIKYIVPIGLEKSVPSVRQAAQWCGAKFYDISLGADFGMFCISSNAIAVTEIEALRILAGVEAMQVAAGGIGGSEGAVVLVARGTDDNIRHAVELIESIKGEPPVRGNVGVCSTCKYACRFKGQEQEELPEWLRAN